MQITDGQTALASAIKASAFIGIHLGCLLVIFVGFSWTAFAVCLALYVLRMFAITAGYHRYFSHRTYQATRWFQFLIGFIGASSAQNGPIWWASHHRSHHQHSDTELDVHSAKLKGLWWSHVGWVLSDQFRETQTELVRDLLKIKEIVWLDRCHYIAPISLAIFVFVLGYMLNLAFPALNTSGFQLLVWGFFISTTLLYHGTFCINSLTHMWGSRRFNTTDNSRNSLLLAIITLGEGWHNNHHRYPGSERQGFYWWELDLSHYGLKLLSLFGIVWNLRTAPVRIYQEAIENKKNTHTA